MVSPTVADPRHLGAGRAFRVRTRLPSSPATTRCSSANARGRLEMEDGAERAGGPNGIRHWRFSHLHFCYIVRSARPTEGQDPLRRRPLPAFREELYARARDSL
jgi:hypothetical protein